MECNSCEVVYVNGVKCHEVGCSEAYKDEVRECEWCGSDFKPEDRLQRFCCDDCREAFYGYE